MKKCILFLTCFIFTFSLHAQQSILFYKSNATVEVIPITEITEITTDNPSGILSISKKDGSPTQLLESEIDSITFSQYVNTYNKTNEIIDILDGCRAIDWIFGGAETTTGVFDLTDGVNFAQNGTSKFGKGYKFKRDQPFLDYNGEEGHKKIFQFFPASDVIGLGIVKSVVGFWINRADLKGMPLQFTSHSGGTWEISQDELKIKGFVAYQRGVGSKGYDQIEVTGVDGDYSHITIRDDNSNVNASRLFNMIIENNTQNIKEITFWNPTLLYEEQDVDPYYVYQSESQRNASPLRGKTILVMGDSQQNDATISHGIARRLGVNILHCAMGGHRIKYNNNSSLGQFAGWMYHWEARKQILAKKADLYYLQISTNDDSGGGDSSVVATKAVLDNYPVIGDDDATINAKLALFNAMTEQQKNDIFAYKQTYSAFLKQINTLYPDAKVTLATIPISSYNVTNNGEYIAPNTADSQRADKDWVFQSIRNNISELANLYNNCRVCDLYNNGGITWENFPKKVTGLDSVHWTVEAKTQFIDPIIQTLLK